MLGGQRLTGQESTIFVFRICAIRLATDMFDMGAGEFMVQTALGHADIKTTRDYVHIKNQNLCNQLENLADSNKPSENMG